VAGFVYYVTVTNQGGNYTSNPTVTISGGGCTGITAVADIYRPVIDAGKASSIDWPVGYGAGPLEWGPGLTPYGGYLIIDHLEIRNIYQVARDVNSIPDGVITAFLGNEQGGSGHITYSNNYIHGRFTDCTLNSCNASNQEQADRAIILQNPTDEAANNVVSNGDSYFTGTSSTGCGANDPCAFSEHSIFINGDGGSIHNNYVYAIRWMTHAGGNGSTPVLIYNNEMWLVLYDVGSAHENEMYSLLTTGSLYEYNNIFHSAVSGASNQQQMGNGTTQYFFNNVSWGLGGGTFNYSIDTQNGAGPGGGNFYYYNNTMYANASATTPCLSNGGSSSYVNNLTVVIQNNYCVTNQSQYWLVQAGSPTWENQAGSATAATVQASSTVQSPSTAVSQGYAISTLFAPTSSSNNTVTFASGAGTANLSGLCTGNLTPLCEDINGNPRPTSGGWQAGAYQYSTAGSTSTSTTQVAPPSGLVATVQ
jgi:hypothetical protein